MDNVISLTGKTNADVTRNALLDFLAEARREVEAGNIESMTGIMLYKTADMAYYCVGMTSVPTVVGCLEFAKRRLMDGD